MDKGLKMRMRPCSTAVITGPNPWTSMQQVRRVNAAVQHLTSRPTPLYPYQVVPARQWPMWVHSRVLHGAWGAHGAVRSSAHSRGTRHSRGLEVAQLSAGRCCPVPCSIRRCPTLTCVPNQLALGDCGRARRGAGAVGKDRALEVRVPEQHACRATPETPPEAPTAQCSLLGLADWCQDAYR